MNIKDLNKCPKCGFEPFNRYGIIVYEKKDNLMMCSCPTCGYVAICDPADNKKEHTDRREQYHDDLDYLLFDNVEQANAWYTYHATNKLRFYRGNLIQLWESIETSMAPIWVTV